MDHWLYQGLVESTRVPSSRYATTTARDGEELPVIEVGALPDLIQIVGYLKSQFNGHVYLRGQQTLYNAVVTPSLFRSGRKPEKAASLFGGLLAETGSWACRHPHHAALDCPEELAESKGWLPRGLPRYAVEGLLQHYGVDTRYIDVVDNIWVALWFACHRIIVEHEYAHVVRENRVDHAVVVSEDAGGGLFSIGPTRVYLLAVSVPGIPREPSRGLLKFPDARVLDLRRALPSYFLRPHSQHGLVIRPRDDAPENLRYTAFSLRLADALDWLGEGLALSSFAVFPPPTVDLGYQRLLHHIDRAPRQFRRQIVLYGGGY